MNRHPGFQILFITILTAIAPWAQAQDGLEYDFFTDDDFAPSTFSAEWNTEEGEIRFWPFVYEFKQTAGTPGNVCRNVTIMGQYAYVADGYSGLQVMDISDPRNPALVGSFDTPGYVYQTHIEGVTAYVADHSGGLCILDLSDPASPVELGSVTVSGVALGVFVTGNMAYVGGGSGGWSVVDVTDPANPAVVSIVATPAMASRATVVAGDRAYVTDGANGLVVFDVEDPVAPVMIGGYVGQGTSRDLEVDGDLAYVSKDGFGLEIIDISNPENPTLAGSLAASGELRGICLAGNRIFQANDGAGLRVIDVSDPDQPLLIEAIDTEGHVYDIGVDGRFAFVCDQVPGLHSLEISLGTGPLELSSFDPMGYPGTPSVSGNYIYSPAGASGIAVTDISDPSNPVALNNASLLGYAFGTCVDGDLLFVASEINGLTVMDISDPSAPVEIGAMDSSGVAYDVAVHGNHAYLAESDRLTIMDVSEPTSPQHVGIFYSSIDARRVEIDGDRAFLYDPNGNTADLEILDLGNPAAPALLGTLSPPHAVAGMDVRGNDLYIAGGTHELMIYDISDPAAPQLQGEYDHYEGVGRDVVVVGDWAYVAVDDLIYRANIRNSESPYFHSSVESQYFMQLIHTDDYLVARQTNYSRLSIFQIKQHEVDTYRPHVRSQILETGEKPLVRLRFKAQNEGLVTWAYDVGGMGGQNGIHTDQWSEVYTPGTSFLWEANFQYRPGTRSAVSDLIIEWLYDAAQIESVSDIANDQGRQVSLEWTRSGHDFIGDQNQIVQYAVYRRIDGDLALSGQEAKVQGSDALQHNVEMMTSQGWHFLTTVPVLVQDRYAVVVPTLADSTAAEGDYESVFQVVALTGTPGVFFTSAPDSGSSVDNLAPGVPQGILAFYEDAGVDLVWDDSAEEDFRNYRIYRGTDAGFIPGADNLLQEVAVPALHDEVDAPWQYVYKVSAVDFSGNESEVGTVLNTSGANLNGPVFALQRAVPNPFNPSTRLGFSLAETGPVQLGIYDVAGRRVRILVDGVLDSGSHEVHWDGRNQAGQVLASGAYFAVLRHENQVRRERLMLMK